MDRLTTKNSVAYYSFIVKPLHGTLKPPKLEYSYWVISFNQNEISQHMEWPKNKTETAMPKVVLHFMRHSIKEKAPEKNDTDILLSQAGRELAAKKLENPVDMRFAHVVGSPRVRTHETGAVAATRNPETNPADLGIGKMRINEALDFLVDDTEYGKRFNGSYMEGKMMSFLVHESDALAKERGDTTSSTYSGMAASIAGIVSRNFNAASRGASMLEQSEHPENEPNDFERIFATHGGSQECFLLKVLEKTKGSAARDEFLSRLAGNGFDFTEGFDVTLSKDNGEEQIRITYKKDNYVFDEVVPVSVIEEIIAEGK